MQEQKQQLEQQFEDYKNQLETQKKALEEQLSEEKVKYEREREQLKYDHQIALRNNTLETANTIANNYNKVLVDDEEWAKKQTLEQLNIEQLAELEVKVQKETSQSLIQKHAIEKKNLEYQYDKQLALAHKDIEQLQQEVLNLREQNSELRSIIKDQNANIVEIADNATRPHTIVEQKQK